MDYVAGHLGYPPEAETWLHDVLGLGPGRKILEVGAGTGKFIPTLQQTGCEIIALEPIAEMRGQLVHAFPGVTALAGDDPAARCVGQCRGLRAGIQLVCDACRACRNAPRVGAGRRAGPDLERA